MKILIVGLGSMGTRRIRCLQSIGNFDLGGFDIRKDRLEQSFDDYAIKTFSSFDDAIEKFTYAVCQHRC